MVPTPPERNNRSKGKSIDRSVSNVQVFGGKKQYVVYNRSKGKSIDLLAMCKFLVGKINMWCVFGGKNGASCFIWREPSKGKKKVPPN